jgi:CCR4-NOT transcription complex subunit 1
MFRDLVPKLKRNANAAFSAFVVFLANTLVGQLSSAQITTAVQSTHPFYLISNLIEELSDSPDLLLRLVNALIDQLRFPSRVTVFFVHTILTLFNVQLKNSKAVLGIGLNELILRALLERAVTPAPHPAGLKACLKELFEGQKVNIWNLEFVAKSEVVLRFLKATATAFGFRMP